MCSAQRRIGPPLIQQLLDEPHRFEFFQAIRILEAYFVSKGADRADVLADHVRFRSSVSLEFPSSEIEQLRAAVYEDGLEWEDIAPNGVARALSSVEIVPAFIGLLGVGGTLPLHYTDRLVQQELRKRDHGPRAFFDVFFNRTMVLFCKAWKKYRLNLQYELDRENQFLPLILSVAGVGQRDVHGLLEGGEGSVFDDTIAHFSALIRQQAVSASVLQQILNAHFQVPMRIEQFVGAWYRIPETQRTRLGGASAALGRMASCGERVWQRDLRVRVWIGPLDGKQYQQFLRGAPAAKALEKMLLLLTGVCKEYEVRLILRSEDIEGTELRSDRGLGGRLSRDTFLQSRPATADFSERSYEVNCIH